MSKVVVSNLFSKIMAVAVIVAVGVALFAIGHHPHKSWGNHNIVSSHDFVNGKYQRQENVPGYYDRNVSEYATGEDGIDQKVVLKRGTKEYQIFTKAVMIGGDWELEDEGHYDEHSDDGIVTCELDNALLKREDNEKLGTINKVIINLSSRSATLVSIAGKSYARDITQSK